MKTYNYLLKDDILDIIKQLRKENGINEKARMFLDNKEDYYIEDTLPFCLVNALIFNILDTFKIYEKREVFIFYESFCDNGSYKYMSKIKDHMLLEREFKDKEILMVHILTQIKDAFFILSTVLDRIVYLDHSLDDYLDAFDDSNEFSKVLYEPDLDPENMDPYTLRDNLNKIPDKFLKEIHINPITRLMKSGVKVNRNQILQNFIWGLVPDKLHPDRMEDVFVMEGCFSSYMNRDSLFIDGNIGRTAIINSKLETKETGALSKITGSILMNAVLNAPMTREVIHDCGTKRHRTITIKSEKDLKFNRFAYYLKPDGTYDFIDINRKDLIGKTLKVRSMTLCEGEHVCEMCFGHLHKFNQDTEVTKVNFGLLILVTLAAILQGVISIKHSISGNLQDIYVIYNGERLHLRDFIKKYAGDLIIKMGYNKIHFNSKDRDMRLVLSKDRKSYQLFIDGKEVILENSFIIEDLGNNDNDLTVKIVLPNQSVLTRADDLQRALKEHSSAPEFASGWDKDMSIDDKIEYIIKFLEKYINFDHKNYAEGIAYCMIRDSEDHSKRPTADSKDIHFIKVQDVIRNPKCSDNLASTIPYGDVQKQLMTIKNPNSLKSPASDYDILYMVKEKSKETSPYFKINKMLDGFFTDNTEEE